jgi:hypothetical protein
MTGMHMSGMSSWDFGTIVALGAFHGINPAMGWLFAVALAFQAGTRRALVAALGPIAVGHAVSMGLTVLLIEELRLVAADTTIKIAGAALLMSFALWRIFRSHRHPRWVGMQLRWWELGFWSFLVSTACGAGLMLFPVMMNMPSGPSSEMIMSPSLPTAAAAVLVHTAAMVTVAGIAAAVVYETVGVGVLRRGWFNLDRLWAYALVAGAATTVFAV